MAPGRGSGGVRQPGKMSQVTQESCPFVIAAELDALLPTLLDKAFRGEL